MAFFPIERGFEGPVQPGALVIPFAHSFRQGIEHVARIQVFQSGDNIVCKESLSIRYNSIDPGCRVISKCHQAMEVVWHDHIASDVMALGFQNIKPVVDCIISIGDLE